MKGEEGQQSKVGRGTRNHDRVCNGDYCALA